MQHYQSAENHLNIVSGVAGKPIIDPKEMLNIIDENPEVMDLLMDAIYSKGFRVKGECARVFEKPQFFFVIET